jgi:hypothetical protein
VRTRLLRHPLNVMAWLADELPGSAFDCVGDVVTTGRRDRCIRSRHR